jgi:hypothetical protein
LTLKTIATAVATMTTKVAMPVAATTAMLVAATTAMPAVVKTLALLTTAAAGLPVTVRAVAAGVRRATVMLFETEGNRRGNLEQGAPSFLSLSREGRKTRRRRRSRRRSTGE